MIATDKYQELLRALRDRTAEGRLQWEETPDAEAFKALFQSGTIVISRENIYGARQEDDSRLLRLDLLTPGGRVASHVAASSMTGGEGYEQLSDLWELARTNARKGDQLVEDLLREVR